MPHNLWSLPLLSESPTYERRERFFGFDESAKISDATLAARTVIDESRSIYLDIANKKTKLVSLFRNFAAQYLVNICTRLNI